MIRLVRTTALCSALGLALFSLPAAGQAPAPARPTTNPAMAAAGTYVLDAEHSGMVWRILHQFGISFSTFRMPGLSGKLTWDPNNIEASKVDCTVAMNDVLTHVPGFGGEIAYEARFFDAGKFPTARFVSTSVRRTGPTTGVITGDLTFKGVSHPMSFDTELIGVVKNARGMTIIGLTATGTMKRSLWGYKDEPGDGDDVHFVMDLEFDNPPPAA